MRSIGLQGHPTAGTLLPFRTRRVLIIIFRIRDGKLVASCGATIGWQVTMPANLPSIKINIKSSSSQRELYLVKPNWGKSCHVWMRTCWRIKSTFRMRDLSSTNKVRLPTPCFWRTSRSWDNNSLPPWNARNGQLSTIPTSCKLVIHFICTCVNKYHHCILLLPWK